tara:strand:+ start:640 stop:1098 length:459 start_codon:yes stop_codon:yes gene_type:complete
MPVSFKVIDNRTSISKKIKDMERQLENYKVFFLQDMAEYIVSLSPVDTGTYIMSHNLASNTVGGVTKSDGKPRNQPYQPFVDAALSKLFSQIAGLSDSELSSLKFTNTAFHANKVEYESNLLKDPSKGAVYTSARREANNISSRAAIKAKSI